jgi:hypothetical protein
MAAARDFAASTFAENPYLGMGLSIRIERLSLSPLEDRITRGDYAAIQMRVDFPSRETMPCMFG